RSRAETRKLQPRNRPNVQRDRQHASGSRAQRAQFVAAFFFRGDVFEIALLLFETHRAETELSLELRADAFAETRQRERFDVERVGTRETGIGVLVFTVLFERDRSILRDDELRAILVSFEFAGDAPQPGFYFLLGFESLAPDFQREAAGGVA